MTVIASHPELALDPPYHSPEYRSSSSRAPSQPLVLVDARFLDGSGPVFADHRIQGADADLTRQHAGEPLGERINVSGRLLDSGGLPITGQLVELWQANAAGRYHHPADQHPAPLDPNFSGAGRCLTGPDGSWRFVTVKPGAYPWGNHPNAWRPAHLHFSVFGRAFTQRLVTQMYFPGDPLLEWDPIYNSVRDGQSRRRLIAEFDWASTEEEWALGYRFDIVLGSRLVTPVVAEP